MLPVDEPLDVAWAGRAGSRRVGWSSVSGLHASPAEIRHGGRQRGVPLALTPAGARALLGVPAAALSGELLVLDEVAPHLRSLPEVPAEVTASERPRLLAGCTPGTWRREELPFVQDVVPGQQAG